MKPTKYARKGELVIIKIPKIFDRVGYALTLHLVEEQFKSEVTDLLRKLVASIRGGCDLLDPSSAVGRTISPFVFNTLKKAACAEVLERHCFGGRERKIYEVSLPELAGVTGCVTERKMVITGKYYSSRGGFNYSEGVDEYEPAGLHDVQVHCVYTVSIGEDRQYQILATNCERLK